MATDLQSWLQTATSDILKCKTKTELKETWEFHYSDLQSISVSIATQRKAISKVRKALETAPDSARLRKLKNWGLVETKTQVGNNGNAPIFKVKNGIITMGESEAKAYKAELEERITDQSKDIKTMRADQYEQLLSICQKWLNSSEYSERAVAIAAFTGRRAGEILSTGKLKPTSSDTAIFSGQLKKGESKQEPYEIITTHNAQQVAKSLKHIQKVKKSEFSGMSLEEIEHKTNRQLAERMYKLFKMINWEDRTKLMDRGREWNPVTKKYDGEKRYEKVPDITFHDLRKLYIAYLLKGESNRERVRELLGHKKTDTGRHYENWRIVE